MKGTYILFIESKQNVEPNVGKLGIVKIPKGMYAYVGSAMGKSVNLNSRVDRHKKLAKEKKGKKQWHIDYINTSPGVEITGVCRIGEKGIECEVAKLLKETGGKIVAKGLGSSDCKCPTHFFSIDQEVVESFLKKLPDIF